ncbi:MAG: nucleoside-diphosphate kinase [Cytophagales bacterium]|nr:nucleoside-diphosphate kinase [Armatimonadota bacterium]
MATERTYIMVKPDGVERRLTGEIIRRFENRGLTLVGLKMLIPTRETAEKHYAVHNTKPFFGELVDFVTSGPVVAMVWEGPDAVKLTRQMIGATKPADALPGTIRGDFTCDMLLNLIHGSDAPETAAEEIALWFGENGLAR